METYRILPSPTRPRAEIVAAYRDVATSHISDNLKRLNGTGALSAYHGRGKLAGPAFTVRVRPGDNLLLHKALDLAAPGDVLVVDGGGEMAQALLGEVIATYAIARGIGGFVVDGAIRDVASFRVGAFPCFARGTSPRGPYRNGPGEINVPVCIDGMVVHPGDMIVGDEDGLACVPLADAEAILEAAGKLRMIEEKIMAEIKSSGAFARPWLDQHFSA